MTGGAVSSQRAASVPTSLHLDDIASELGSDGTEEASTIQSHFEDNNAKDFSNADETNFDIGTKNHFGPYDDKVEEGHENDKTDNYLPIDHFLITENGDFNDSLTHSNNDETGIVDGNDDAISGLYFGPGSDPIEAQDFGMDEDDSDTFVEYLKQPKDNIQH